MVIGTGDATGAALEGGVAPLMDERGDMNIGEVASAAVDGQALWVRLRVTGGGMNERDSGSCPGERVHSYREAWGKIARAMKKKKKLFLGMWDAQRHRLDGA